MNKALLVIDFINDIAHPDGRIAASAAHVLEQDAIAHACAKGGGWAIQGRGLPEYDAIIKNA